MSAALSDDDIATFPLKRPGSTMTLSTHSPLLSSPHNIEEPPGVSSSNPLFKTPSHPQMPETSLTNSNYSPKSSSPTSLPHKTSALKSSSDLMHPEPPPPPSTNPASADDSPVAHNTSCSRIQIIEWLLLGCALISAIAFYTGYGMFTSITPFEGIFYVELIGFAFMWTFIIPLSFLYHRRFWTKVAKNEKHHHQLKQIYVKRVLKTWDFWIILGNLCVSLAFLIIGLRFAYPMLFVTNSGTQIRRVASINSTTVIFHFRDPTISLLQANVIGMEYRLAGTTDAFTKGPFVSVSAEQDWTAWPAMVNLFPATSYEFRFATDRVRGNVSYPIITTAPVSGIPCNFSFVWGSGFMSSYYSPVTAWDDIVDHLQPDFVIFLGDFIYADVPTYGGNNLDAYRYLYRQNFQNPGLQRALTTTPFFGMYDDHELQLDYPNSAGKGLGMKWSDYATMGVAIDGAWMEYVGGGNPPPPPGAASVGSRYFAFERGDVSFFVLEVRSNATDVSAPDDASKSMLGLTQKLALFQWMLDAEAKGQIFKFVFVTVPFTTNMISTDSLHYGHYKTERAEILNFIKTKRISGVVFFTAGSNFAYAMELQGQGKALDQTGLFEFSVSPVNGYDVTQGGLSPSAGLENDGGVDDAVVFSNVGQGGHVQFYGKVTVNTASTVTKPQPSFTVDYYGAGGDTITEITKTAAQVRSFV